MGAATCLATTANSAVWASGGIQVGVISQTDGPHLVAYLEALRDIAEVDSVVLAVDDNAIALQARSLLGDKLLTTYGSCEQLLKNHQPDLVIVCLEARAAPQAVMDALERGCHVFAEKPACVRVEDFRVMAQLAERKQRHLMLALANRLNEEVTAARDLVIQGKIGRIYGIEMHLVADQTRLTRSAYRDSWYAFKDRAGGGHLIWLGIHWLDLAMYLTGSSISKVNAMITNIGGQPIEVEDSAVLSLQFDNGALGTFTSGYYLDSGYHSHIKIWGSGGWLEIQSHGGVPLQWYSQTEPGSKTQSLKTTGSSKGYTPLVRACVQAISGEQEPPLTTRDSLRVIETVFAGYRAAEKGCVQSIEP